MIRLDVYLTENGLARSRERAKALIREGKVSVNSKTCTKPAYQVLDTDTVESQPDDLEFVGRGGLKLQTAFDEFGLDVKDLVCADIGASTGGFTQCLLNHGAKKVYAVDVGHGQLDKSLIEDDRVENCEGVNARELRQDSFDPRPSFISVDVSFISLGLIIRPLFDLLTDGGKIAALIKPQFEAGKKALNKKGIVTLQKDHIRVLENLTALFTQVGLSVRSIVPSSITGGDGNIEYLALLEKNGSGSDMNIIDFSNLVKTAFLKFR